MRMRESDPQVVDIVFDVEGTSVPVDSAWPLLREVERRLPWFADEEGAGIHPLRGAATAYGVVLLAQRTKLVLRAPAARLADCLALQGAELDVGGDGLRIGPGRERPLRPSVTLSAQRVAIAATDAQAFEREARRLLEALGVAGDLISGRRRHGRGRGREITGYALSVAGLNAADSLRIQGAGLGAERGLGWGLFVPAKAIVAAED